MEILSTYSLHILAKTVAPLSKAALLKTSRAAEARLCSRGGLVKPLVSMHQTEHRGDQMMTLFCTVKRRKNSLKKSDCHEEIQINRIKEKKRNSIFRVE